ncbi:hypothetical protein DL95DRAFT_464636 [Leptodontidium sp. 2 PMI_412]|nr:hypothetical protein DL95DRAFT_464636 [Leptodontidium sp. 2 PMI_412]
MAHNPNVYVDGGTDDPATALQAGANALGPDVNRSKDIDKLVIAHGGFLFIAGPGSDSDPDLIAYLKHLRVLAKSNPAFALVAFDCKKGTYFWQGQDIGADFGLELLTAIRTHPTNFVPLDIVISVPDRQGVSVFQKIYKILTPTEAIAIDQEDDPDSVARHFQQLGATSNAVYGYGNTFQLPAFVPSLRRAIEWTVAWIREHIRIGADGVMSNFELIIPEGLPDLPALKPLVDMVKTDREIRRLVRMATRSDRILGSSKHGYLLWVYTGNTGAAGTDAKITFVVRGELGIAKKTVDTSLQGRMESGKTDFVVIHSRDLGNLFEVTIYNDMGASFLGNSARRCDKTSVVSVRYGVDVTAVFGVNIDVTPVTRSFA